MFNSWNINSSLHVTHYTEVINEMETIEIDNFIRFRFIYLLQIFERIIGLSKRKKTKKKRTKGQKMPRRRKKKISKNLMFALLLT